MNKEILLNIITGLDFIDNLYDIIRLVDPREKKVYSYFKPEKQISENLSVCYNVWEKDKICENCISMRAYNQNKTFVKIENTNDRIYTVAAAPVNTGESIMVIELLKDITNEGIIDITGMGSGEISKLISHRNILMVKDSLTRIYNELYIYERLPHELLKAKENSENHNTVLFRIKVKDIDSVNNAYGYDAGDFIIKEIAEIIKKMPKNREDCVSRYQGIEFILVMQNINENQAERICRHLDKDVSESEFIFNGKNIAVDISIGYTVLKADQTVGESIDNAGRNLYKTNYHIKINIGDNNELFQKAQLTPREKEVALLLLQGETNSDIAKILYVGLSTVKKHISSIFEKTKVKSRTEFISKVRS